MNKQYLYYLTGMLLFINVLVACTNYNEEELYGTAKAEANCEIGPVSFKLDIEPILSRNCIFCHSGTSAAGGVPLETYEGVKQSAKNKLVGAIKQLPGFIPMPPGRKLSDCEIAKIEAWVNEGTPNN